jgi:uncharacterized protein (TIGR02147 family)
MESIVMPSVFEYDNYRQFLNDYYSARKKLDSSYSYARFAKDAGIASPNYLKLVMDGERSLSTDQIHRFARAISLYGLELDFFETLVHLNQSDSPESQYYYSKRLQDFRTQISKSAVRLNANQIGVEWYFPALALYLDQRPVEKTEFSKIAPKLGVTEFQLNAMTSQLLQRDFLSIKENTYHMNFSSGVFVDKNSNSFAQKNFQQSQLEQSLRVFKESYGRHTKFISHTFTISSDSFDAWTAKVYAFLQTLARASEEESADQVLQLNVQMFSIFDLK